MMRALAAVLLSVASVGSAAAQSTIELLEARRYEDAAASLRDASPEDARAGAMRIFNHVYRWEFQQDRFTEAAQGFAAAKRAPHLEESFREMLDFWQGMAWFASTRDTALSEEEASARLEEARSFLLASGDYRQRANLPDAVAEVERQLELSGRVRTRG
jgi:hypothetical protein